MHKHNALLSSTKFFIGHQTTVGRSEPASEISSLADSGEDIGKVLSASPLSPRKRKRSSLGNDSISDQDSLPGPSPKATKLFRSTSAGALIEDSYLDESAEEVDQVAATKTVTLPLSEARSKSSPEIVLPKQDYRKGKRKGKKPSGDNVDNGITGASKVQTPTGREVNEDAMSSNEDEDENDEAGDVPGAENTTKTEEGGQCPPTHL